MACEYGVRIEMRHARNGERSVFSWKDSICLDKMKKHMYITVNLNRHESISRCRTKI